MKTSTLIFKAFDSFQNRGFFLSVFFLFWTSFLFPVEDTFDQQVRDLLARMSVEEKAAQLVHYWKHNEKEPDAISFAAGFRPPVRGKISAREYAEFINGLQKQVIEGSPNRIPALIHDECLHGATAYGRATSFPQCIGLAATFDPDLVKRVATAIAAEERSIGVRMVMAPVLNLCRDPRWGTNGRDLWRKRPSGRGFGGRLCETFSRARHRDFNQTLYCQLRRCRIRQRRDFHRTE